MKKKQNINIFLKALLVWFVIMLTESIHGYIRSTYLAPFTGDIKARQIGVFIGALLILLVTLFFIKFIKPNNRQQAFTIGLLWVLLTISFEIILGRIGFQYSWEYILSDYNLRKGGLMPIGLIFMAITPFIAAMTKGTIPAKNY